MQLHELLFCFISLHISNSSVSASLVGHVLYSADLMSATYISYSLLMVHRYIYSRYSPVFLTLYQLYHSLPSSTFNLFLSLYLSVATWVTVRDVRSRSGVIRNGAELLQNERDLTTKSGGTILASARALCLDRLSRVWLRISGGLNCCQESRRGVV